MKKSNNSRLRNINLLPPLSLIILLNFLTLFLKAQDAVNPGQFIVEPPTLTNLGFEWHISGDNNRNAIVAAEYRVFGSKEWKEALPLLRIGDEHVGRETEHLDYITPRMFAGSILDLLPDTEYECRFTMRDKDNGIHEERTVKVHTRSEPKAYEGGRVLHVYPVKWKGEKKEPSFTTLQGGILRIRYRRLVNCPGANCYSRRYNRSSCRPL